MNKKTKHKIKYISIGVISAVVTTVVAYLATNGDSFTPLGLGISALIGFGGWLTKFINPLIEPPIESKSNEQTCKQRRISDN
jgi:hypothetical protein